MQALPITRHMLFVGFSLTDDNFHRIADDVRKALRGPKDADLPERFGTALLPFSGLTEERWRRDLHCVSMASPQHSEGDGKVLRAARRIDILLDFLLAESPSNAAHILDPTYGHLLTDGEIRIRAALQARQALGPSVGTAPAWAPVRRLLSSFGEALAAALVFVLVAVVWAMWTPGSEEPEAKEGHSPGQTRRQASEMPRTARRETWHNSVNETSGTHPPTALVDLARRGLPPRPRRRGEPPPRSSHL